MEAALIVFVLVWIGTGYVGVKLIGAATKRRPAPPIPEARLANTEGAEYAYQKSADLAKRGGRKLGKGLGISFGLFLITWPILIVVWFLTTDWSFGMGTMGRKLRVRGREALPSPAHGDGWVPSTETAEVVDVGSIAPPTRDRDAIVDYWLLAARMEHASVPAFSRLALQLAAVGAPARLLRATHIAALDEIRHAETCFAITRALSGESHDAGPIVELTTDSESAVTLERLAIESLVDGCIAEGIAADLAARGAELATEPAIREALAMIARDEATHAELAWDVLAWCLAASDAHVGADVGHTTHVGADVGHTTHVGANVGRAAHVGQSVRAALDAQRLDAVAPSVPAGNRAELARYGIVDARDSKRIAIARRDAVRARLSAMLDGAIARAA